MSTDSSDSSKSRLVQKVTPKAEPNARSSKSSSPRKVAANRRNALRSTGPKTERGKNNSKYNALKHGLLARQAVRIARECGESRQAFQKLLLQLAEELKPEGYIEGVIVEKIALCILRSKRAISFENGAIRRNVHAAGGPDPEIRPGFPEELRKSVSGYRTLIAFVENARSEFEGTGELQAKTTHVLKRYFPRSPSLWSTPNGTEDAAKRAATWESWKKSIECELYWLENEVEAKEAKDELQFDLDYETSSIPSEPDLQRLHRYEAANERQMFALLKQLQELQDRRRRQPSRTEEEG